MKSRSLQGVLAGAFFLMILLPLAGVTFWGGRVLRSHLGGFGDREVMVLARSIAEGIFQDIQPVPDDEVIFRSIEQAWAARQRLGQ